MLLGVGGGGGTRHKPPEPTAGRRELPGHRPRRQAAALPRAEYQQRSLRFVQSDASATLLSVCHVSA